MPSAPHETTTVTPLPVIARAYRDPPNLGLAASLGVSFPIFWSATFLGRIIKMLFFAGLGRQLLG